MKLDIIINAEDLASNKFQKVDKELQKVSRASGNVKKSFQSVQESSRALVAAFRRVAVGAAAVFSAFQVSKSFIQVNAQFERFQTTLETLYKSHSKAQAVFDSILNFASKTPFEVNQLTQAWVKMKAMGLESNLDMFQKIGDAVSALGGSQETFDGIITALGQMQAKGKVSAEELMQLAERGVPVFEILQKKLGLTKEQLANIGNEGIDASKAINALVEGMGEKFKGNMEKMSNTWQGIMSNLKDSWTRFMKILGDTGIFQNIKNALKDLQDKIQKAFDSGQAQKWAAVIAKGFSIVAAAVKDVGVIVWEFATGLYEIGKVILNALAQPFIIVYNTVKKIFTEDGYFEKVIMSIPEYLKAVGKIAITILPDAFLKALELIGLQIVKWSTIAFKPLVVAFTWVKDNLIAFGKTAVDKLGEVFHGLKVFVQNVFIKMFNFLANKFNSFIQNMANSLKKIPFMKGIAEKVEGFKIPLMVEVKADYKPMFSDTEKAYKKFNDVRKKFEGDWKKALEYINKRSAELVNGLDSDAKRAIDILKTQGGEYGKMVGSILEKTYEAGAKSWEIVKQKIVKLRELTKNLSPELQKQFEELFNLVNKKASEYAKTTEDANKKIVENTKEATKKLKGFWKDFLESISKNTFWSRVISFSKKVWAGIKGAFSGGAKEGETGIVARVKNSFSNIAQGFSAGGLVGAGVSFLTDQLLQNEKIQKALQKIFDVIQKLLTPIAEVIAPIIETIGDVLLELRPVFKLIAKLLKPIAKAIREVLKVLTKIDSFFKGVAKGIWKNMESALKIIQKIVEAIKRAVEGVKNAGKSVVKGVKGAWNSTIGKITGIKLHTGGFVKPIIAHSGMYVGGLKNDEVPAILQRGEYVINRNATSKYKPVLDAINEGKPLENGNVYINVTINADRLDRRFVEDEFIPMLEDYARKGRLKL